MPCHVHLAPVAPWNEGAPALPGPAVYGVSVGKPCDYVIPATGERPLRFEAEGLPDGLRLDPGTGRIAGAAQQDGDRTVLLRAQNRHGRAEKPFTIAVGRGLALTPPMGWNSWNAWRYWVNDAGIRAAARALVNTGLAARGYGYVNIDSTWQGERGGPHGAIQPNRKFPDMGALSAFVHGLGLKFGLYSTPWTVPYGCTPEHAKKEWGGAGLIGCSSGEPDPKYVPNAVPKGRYVGRVKHEPQDVAQWVAWGIDFLKYDWNPTDPVSLARMGRLLKDAPRDIVLSICTAARLEDAEAIKPWASMWRGLPDTRDTWSSVLQNAFLLEDVQGEDWRPHVGPGAWNDLDMLALGPQFQGPSGCQPNRLAPDEQLAAMTAWALYPSPLILSCDLTGLSDFELRLFANEEVLAVNQDPLGKPAVRVLEQRTQPLRGFEPARSVRIWAKPLDGGGVAVGFFNLGTQPARLDLPLEALDLKGPVQARNLWERRALGQVRDRLAVEVPAHGAQLVLAGP